MWSGPGPPALLSRMRASHDGHSDPHRVDGPLPQLRSPGSPLGPERACDRGSRVCVGRASGCGPQEQHPTPLGPLASVNVPTWAKNMISPCFTAYRFVRLAFGGPNVTPACLETLGASTKIVPTETQFSNAPPLYYVVVGIPSLFLAGDAAVYTMRLVGDLVNAAIIALGISLLVRYYPRRTVLVGVLIALSPMVLFLMAVVSSSGLEIASGFATWCGALCIAEHPRVPRPLAAWTAVAAALLVLSRPTSPLDLVIICIVFALLVGWRGLRRRFHNPSLRPVWIPVVGVLSWPPSSSSSAVRRGSLDPRRPILWTFSRT